MQLASLGGQANPQGPFSNTASSPLVQGSMPEVTTSASDTSTGTTADPATTTSATTTSDATTSDATTSDATSTSTTTASETEEIPLPELSNMQDTWEPYDKNSIPIYWHIPKAGGSTVKDTIGACHRLVMATEFGISDGHATDTEIAVVYPKPPGDVTDDRSPFVNVDTSTPAGIERAAKMGFADSHLAGCVVSPFLYETNALFTQTAKGRLFAVFRHPVTVLLVCSITFKLQLGSHPISRNSKIGH